MVTNYKEGGRVLQNGRGGHVKFDPYEKGGGRKSFEVVLMWELEI